MEFRKVPEELEVFMCQVYTESPEEFSIFEEKISRIVPQSVVAYCQDNWWGKKDLVTEWTDLVTECTSLMESETWPAKSIIIIALVKV